MRALITGGAGFVGSHLAEYLLAEGETVVVLDDLSTGSINNIGHLKNHARFSYVIDSVFNEHLAAELIDYCDVVFHLAAAVGVKLIVESPVRTIETNVEGTYIVLRHAGKKKKKVLITSTSEVYGKSRNHPFKESDDLVIGSPNRGRWSYACSKALDEFLALAHWHEKGLPVIIARLFNTVGPRQTGQYGMVVPTFVQQALTGKPITVFGTGEQKRSFTWVGDVVQALTKLMREDKAVGEIFNIGHHKEITIRSLAEKVQEICQSNSEIVFLSYEEAYAPGFEDMARRLPAIDKIQHLIGYHPTLDLTEILIRVAEHLSTELTQETTQVAETPRQPAIVPTFGLGGRARNFRS